MLPHTVTNKFPRSIRETHGKASFIIRDIEDLNEGVNAMIVTKMCGPQPDSEAVVMQRDQFRITSTPSASEKMS